MVARRYVGIFRSTASRACAGVAAVLACVSAPAQETRPVPADIRSYPRGVTVLGPAPAVPPDREVIRVRTGAASSEPDPAPEPLPLSPPPLPEVVFDAGVVYASRQAFHLPPPTTIGPSPEDQLRALGVAPGAPAGGIPAPYSSWKPTPAYVGDAANPYPWNPATWNSPAANVPWSPVPAWPPGQDRRNWSPVTWASSVFDATWTPQDSWGRSLPGASAPTPSAPEAGQATAPAPER